MSKENFKSQLVDLTAVMNTIALAIYGAQLELNAPDLLGDIARVAKNTAKQCEQMVMILESEGADKLH